jgi:hypothetical protein
MKMDLQTKLRMKIAVAMLGILVLMAATKVFYDTIVVGSLNKVLWVDGTKYKTLAACYADLPSSGGTCEVPPNYTETLTADLAMTKSNAGFHFNGPANITQGAFRVTMPSGVNNAFILTPFAHSSNQAGSNLGVSFQGYTGAAGAFDFGDTSGFVNNLRIAGINVGMSSALANATAFRMTNVEQSAFDDIGCIHGPVSGHACFRGIGTGAFFSGLTRIMSIDCEGTALATNNKCIELGAISNDYTIIGGHCNVFAPANGSICVDVLGTNAGNNKVFGFDCDTAITCASVESTSSTALYGVFNMDSGITNSASFGAGSFGNVVYTDANLPFTDSGVAGTNSVINPARMNWRTDRMQISMGATFYNWIDVTDSTSRDIEIYGAGGNKRLNSGSGASQILFNFDSGTAGFNFCGGTSATTSCTLWNPVTTAQRTLTSPNGNSSTVMPFNFTTTAATTDNVTVTGMTASGHCTLTPTNTAAAAGIASVFISTKAANQITVTHTATANWTFDGLCTSN